MTELKIPGCRYHSGAGNSWPTHRGKARNKTANRRRVIAELNKENANGLCRLV